ncbi:MAG: pentapeptide repeat-containing protein [Bacteroidota bacterium]
MKKLIVLLVVSLFLTTGCRPDNLPVTNNGISSGTIIKSIDKGKAVVVQGKIITDDLDFTSVKKTGIFSSSVRIAEIGVPVTFLDCIFMGRVTTNGQKDKSQIFTRFGSVITFEACDFRDEADFSNCTVEGMVNFTGAIFREKALFNNVTFNGRQVYFTAFSSEKLFSMQESVINGSADFFKGKVTGKISFQSTDFRGTARFSDMDCNGKSDFSLANFRSDALFTYANFGGDFRMSDVNVAGRLDLISVSFNSGAWLTNAVFSGKVNLTKSVARAVFDLSGSVFMHGKPVTEEFSIEETGQLITKGAKFAVLNEFTTE